MARRDVKDLGLVQIVWCKVFVKIVILNLSVSLNVRSGRERLLQVKSNLVRPADRTTSEHMIFFGLHRSGH